MNRALLLMDAENAPCLQTPPAKHGHEPPTARISLRRTSPPPAQELPVMSASQLDEARDLLRTAFFHDPYLSNPYIRSAMCKVRVRSSLQPRGALQPLSRLF